MVNPVPADRVYWNDCGQLPFNSPRAISELLSIVLDLVCLLGRMRHISPRFFKPLERFVDCSWLAVNEVVTDQIIFGIAGLVPTVDDAELLQDAISDGSRRGCCISSTETIRREVASEMVKEIVLHLHDELSAHSTGA